MKKRVNVTASHPIRTITPTVYGTLYDVEMSVGDIFRCICGRANVEEILNDGTTLSLGTHNYDKDNNKPKVIKPVPEKKELKVTPVVQEEVPVPEVKEEKKAAVLDPIEEIIPVVEPIVEETPVVEETVVEEEIQQEEETTVTEKEPVTGKQQNTKNKNYSRGRR